MTNRPRQYPRTALGIEDELLGQLIDTLFFAGLGTEEGLPTRVRIVYHEDGVEKLRRATDAVPIGGGYVTRPAWEVLALDTNDNISELSVEDLKKFAPAVSHPTGFVVVGRHAAGHLVIQGVAYRLGYTEYKPLGEDDLVFLNTNRPGHVAIACATCTAAYEDGRCTKGVPLDELLFNKRSAVKTAIEQICRELIVDVSGGLGSPKDIVHRVVRDLVSRVSKLPHGGLIVMCPSPPTVAGKYQLHSSTRQLLSKKVKAYADGCVRQRARLFQPSAVDLDDQIDAATDEEGLQSAQESLDLVLAGVAQLAAVDKALLVGPNLEVISAGFEVKAQSPHGLGVLEAMNLEGNEVAEFPINRYGTKHAAAAAFAHHNVGSVVFAVSHDGAVRCLHRRLGEEPVLLWQILISDE